MHVSVCSFLCVCVCICMYECVCVGVCECWVTHYINVICTTTMPVTSPSNPNFSLHYLNVLSSLLITSRSTRHCPGSNVSLCMANSL